MSGYSGGTLRGQHERTLDMLEDMLAEQKPLHLILWFLHDCQTDIEQLRQLAELAQKRGTK